MARKAKLCCLIRRSYHCPFCGYICTDCWEDEVFRHFDDIIWNQTNEMCEISKMKWHWSTSGRGANATTPCRMIIEKGSSPGRLYAGLDQGT